MIRINSFVAPCAAIVLLGALSASPVHAQSSVEAQLREQIQALRAEQERIAELQRRIDEKLRALESELGVTNEGVASLQSRSATPAARAQPEPRLAVSGDMRLRYQGDYSDATAQDRHSSQLRARFGATYSLSDRVTVGARLVTGDPDDPNSTDVQLSNFDDDLQVSLDLAYAQFDIGRLQLYGGRIPQPFVRTDLLWDSDVNPQGAGAVYRRLLADGAAVRASGLFFVIDEQSVAADSTMLGAQIGYDSAPLGDWKLDASAAYYDYHLGSVAGADAGDFRSNLRNPDGSYRSDFNLAELLLGASWTGAGERWPVRIIGDYVHNRGAATAADTGYGIDLTLGRASRPDDWRVSYGYSVAQTDAVLAAFAHDNIGIGTNYKLHALTLDYVPWPKTLLSATWYHYAPDSALDAGAAIPGDWLDRVRLALLLSF